MNIYEQLVDEYSDKVYVVEKIFKSKAKGLCKGSKIGISKDIATSNEKSCILAEELGHYYTSVGNILDLSFSQNRKQERQARLWAYNKRIGLCGLIRAYERGCSNSHEIAEYLDVTEEFLCEALECYKNKYGICTCVDNYTIYFIPYLSIIKRI
ncbi:MAG: ImmA/IrrE family metallo-endopeptidase [Schaedlerella sp.]|nr:ImmA/IrrE family metallo-endopeptidase [Schaedlerella sp.]